jgi:hypothetical protein
MSFTGKNIMPKLAGMKRRRGRPPSNKSNIATETFKKDQNEENL